MNTLIPEKIWRQCTEKCAPLLALWLLSAGLCAQALAHDFWIEPETFRAKPGVRVPLRVYVGQNFAGDSIPFFPDRFERYVSVGPAGEQAIPGVLGDDPAGAVTGAVPGLYLLALRTKPDKVSFDTSEEFERYLHAEGLERNLARHRERHKPGKIIHETYFRCAKSLLAVGNIRSDATDKALGLPLELIVENNPHQLWADRKLRLRLLYLGKPLEGALVILSNKAKPLDKLKARTNTNGRVEFSLPRRGIWLANSVHMIPAPFFSQYDWESLWASLTFELP